MCVLSVYVCVCAETGLGPEGAVRLSACLPALPSLKSLNLAGVATKSPVCVCVCVCVRVCVCPIFASLSHALAPCSRVLCPRQ